MIREVASALAVLVIAACSASLKHAETTSRSSALLQAPAAGSFPPTDPLAQAQGGLLRGEYADGIYSFKGVAYGADTAKRRFRTPLPAPAWPGVRDARRFGPPCPQTSAIDPATISEDCLSLNVWTPGLADSKARPVLVYFHGGGYSHGAVDEPLYDGAALSRRGDVVVVTVHHRIGGFGYLYLADIGGERYAESGNVGMLDLLLALTWVRDNIAAFGGDPARVTIFGQSGGGAKCATLMAMPGARGLFHGVWTMSGQQVTGRTRAHADETARAVLATLQLPPERVRELEDLPLATVLEAMRGGVWSPVVDGQTLPRDPFAPDAPAQSRHIPMVLGNTLNETTSLIGVADPSTFDLRWDTLPDKLNQHIAQFMGELSASSIVERYRRWYPPASPSQIFFAISTAARSWRGMLLESERRAEQDAPTWVYYVNWQSPLDGGRWGAPHMVDIPLLFNNVAASRYTASGAEGAAATSVQELADHMSAALLVFAHTGDPNTQGLPPWPRFDLKRRAAMIFGTQPEVVLDPRRRERLLFAPVPYVQPGT